MDDSFITYELSLTSIGIFVLRNSFIFKCVMKGGFLNPVGKSAIGSTVAQQCVFETTLTLNDLAAFGLGRFWTFCPGWGSLLCGFFIHLQPVIFL